MSGASEILSEAKVQACIAALHNMAPNSVGDRFNFELRKFDESTGEYIFRCVTSSWMQNVAGKLHGGITATIADQAMGYVVFSLIPLGSSAATAQMNLNYMRPLVPEESLTVKVKVMSLGKTLIHLFCQISHESDPGKVCMSATSVYSFKHK